MTPNERTRTTPPLTHGLRPGVSSLTLAEYLAACHERHGVSDAAASKEALELFVGLRRAARTGVEAAAEFVRRRTSAKARA